MLHWYGKIPCGGGGGSRDNLEVIHMVVWTRWVVQRFFSFKPRDGVHNSQRITATVSLLNIPSFPANAFKFHTAGLSSHRRTIFSHSRTYFTPPDNVSHSRTWFLTAGPLIFNQNKQSCFVNKRLFWMWLEYLTIFSPYRSGKYLFY